MTLPIAKKENLENLDLPANLWVKFQENLYNPSQSEEDLQKRVEYFNANLQYLNALKNWKVESRNQSRIVDKKNTNFYVWDITYNSTTGLKTIQNATTQIVIEWLKAFDFNLVLNREIILNNKDLHLDIDF
jgi:hypothetical protein